MHKQLKALQRMWNREFGGTFAIASPPVRVIRGDQDASWYANTLAIEAPFPQWYRVHNIKNEVQKKLGISRFDNLVRVVTYPVATIDGMIGASFGDVLMDGDDLQCISSSNKTFPYEERSEANCLGILAHELAHVFGLTHTGPPTDCMQVGFYVSMVCCSVCHFSDDNRKLVRQKNHEWLKEIPGAIIG